MNARHCGGEKRSKLQRRGEILSIAVGPKLNHLHATFSDTRIVPQTLKKQNLARDTMPKPKKTDSKPQRTAPSKPTAPDWPPLRPLLPALDLSLTPLLTDQIYLIRNFLSGSLCKNYVSFLASLPLTTTPGKPKKDEAVRVNDRFQIEDARFAEMLWSGTALKELVTERFAEEDYNDDKEEDSRDPAMSTELAQRARQLWGGEPLGLNPNIRIYRYSAGQFFGQHCKCCYQNKKNIVLRSMCTY